MKKNNPISTISIAISLTFIFFSSVIYAQSFNLKGSVISLDNEVLSYIQVNVLSENNSIIKQVSTDSLGYFSLQIEKGDYTILLTQYNDNIWIKKIDLLENIDLGLIKVNPAVELDELFITALKDLVKESVDKTTIKVKDEQFFEGDNTVTILSKIQGIIIMDSNIIYDGINITAVRVNNRPMTFTTQQEMMDYLRNIDNKTIQSIEIINPSSKYSALIKEKH